MGLTICQVQLNIYVDMQSVYCDMRFIYVDLQLINFFMICTSYVNMQLFYIDRRDKYTHGYIIDKK